MFDAVIIGGGIVGAAVAYNLSKYKLKIAVLEKENDIATGTTKANSAIIHAGYDPLPGTLMAKLNVRGSALTKEICKKLDVKYNQIGSLVLAFSPQDHETITELYHRGKQNGVQGLEILSKEQVRQKEPLVSCEVISALYAPSAAIVDPWGLCLALLETAVKNSVQLNLENEVIAIEKTQQGFLIHTDKGEYNTKTIFNAAGIYADNIHNMVAQESFKIHTHSGEYFLLDKSEGQKAKHIIFKAPEGETKGVLIAPTIHGNLIVGPNAQPCDKNNLQTTALGLEYVKINAQKSVVGIEYKENIRNFAGLRAMSDREDFIIEQAKDAKGFFDIAGIKSPGLSAASAIGEMAVDMLKEYGVTMLEKENFIDERKQVRFKDLNVQEKQKVIEKDPLYAKVVCRCETVTEAEIIACLNSPIAPVSVDGVKRRVGAGMGRCQGGFCSPKIMHLLAQAQKIAIDKILQDGKNTVILKGKTKEATGDDL